MSKSTWHPHKFQNPIKNTCALCLGFLKDIVWYGWLTSKTYLITITNLVPLILGGCTIYIYIHTFLHIYIYLYMYMRVCMCIYIQTQYTHRYKSIYTDTLQTYIQKGMKHADCFFVSWLWQNKCALKCVVFEQVEREVLRWTSSSNRLAGSQATCETH